MYTRLPNRREHHGWVGGAGKTTAIGLVAMLGLGGMVLPAGAAQLDWTGNSSANWSDPNNWFPSTRPPQDGDVLNFSSPASHLSMVNDLGGLSLAGLEFYDGGFQLDGNPLTVGDLEGSGDGAVTINCTLLAAPGNTRFRASGDNGVVTEDHFDLYLNGPVVLNGLLELQADPNDFGAGGNAHFHVMGEVKGSGDVFAESHEVDGHICSIEFSGTPGNSFDGTLYLHTDGNASIICNKLSGSVVTNRLEVYDGSTVNLSLAGPNQIDPNAAIVLVAGSGLRLGGNYNVTAGSLVLTNWPTDTNACVLDTTDITVGLNGGITSWNDSIVVTPTIKGNLNLNGLLPFDIGGSVYSALDLQAPMGSGGGIAKYGNAALLLETNNSFSGGSFIAEGTMDVRHPGALGAALNVTTISGGVLALHNVAIDSQILHAGGASIAGDLPGSVLTCIGSSCSWSGPVMLDTNLNVLGDITLSGAISGAGGLGFFGLGTSSLAGSADNTFSGTTLVRCPLLQLTKSGAAALAGPLVVGGSLSFSSETRWLNSDQSAGSSVDISLVDNGLVNLNDFWDNVRSVTFTGGQVETGTGQLSVSQSVTANPADTSAVFNGALVLGGSSVAFDVASGPADPNLLLNAVISGPGGLVKSGAGTLTFTANNTYSGATTVNEGLLLAENYSAVGSAGASVAVAANATLGLGPIGQLTGPVSLSGAGIGGTLGALWVTDGGNWGLTGPVSLNNSTTLNVGSGSQLMINAAITGMGPLVKNGLGPLYLNGSGNNTYGGDTLVNSGVLHLSKDLFVIAVPGNLVLGPPPSFATAQAICHQSFLMGGNVITVNANSLLDLNGNNLMLSQLNLNDGGSAQTGAGILGFMAGGGVNVGSRSFLGSSASSSISGNIGLPPNASVIFNVNPYRFSLNLPVFPELDVLATLFVNGAEDPTLAPAGISKEGGGQMRLDSNNTYGGVTRVNGGTLTVANPGALGTTRSGTTVNAGARLVLAGALTVSGETLILNSTNAPALESRGGAGNTWSGPVQLSAPASISAGSNAPLTIDGVISGPGSLTKIGPGTLSLTGSANNSFAGDTMVNEGTLNLSKPPFLQSVPGNLVVGSGLVGAPPAVARHYAPDQIWANLTVNETGLLDLNGFDEYIGAVTLNGRAQIQTGNGTLYLAAADADLTVNPTHLTTASISGRLGLSTGVHHFRVGRGSSPKTLADLAISATMVDQASGGSLEKDAGGILHLTGANTYSGTTTVAGGTLWVDGTQGQSPVQVADGARLQGSGTVGPISFSGTSGVVEAGNGPAILTCSSLNAASGASGTLQFVLNGTVAGTGYDQLNSLGNVNLAGMTLSAALNASVPTNTQFVLISNAGNQPVSGTFNGLPQGASLPLAGQVFQVSYTGGDGNDVVLTKIADVVRPTLSLESIPPGSIKLLWSTNAPGFTLQVNPDLNPTNWASALPLPTVVGPNYVVTNPATGAQQFYRLIQP